MLGVLHFPWNFFKYLSWDSLTFRLHGRHLYKMKYLLNNYENIQVYMKKFPRLKVE